MAESPKAAEYLLVSKPWFPSLPLKCLCYVTGEGNVPLFLAKDTEPGNLS